MENILGNTKDLQLFNSEGKIAYKFIKDFNGCSCEYTYDLKGNVLTYKDSDGYNSKRTYDSKGKVLTYKDSNGVTRGFDIPEYTMEELVQKLGNFKIIK